MYNEIIFKWDFDFPGRAFDLPGGAVNLPSCTCQGGVITFDNTKLTACNEVH